jgi:hypothetical protein
MVLGIWNLRAIKVLDIKCFILPLLLMEQVLKRTTGLKSDACLF